MKKPKKPVYEIKKPVYEIIEETNGRFGKSVFILKDGKPLEVVFRTKKLAKVWLRWFEQLPSEELAMDELLGE